MAAVSVPSASSSCIHLHASCQGVCVRVCQALACGRGAPVVRLHMMRLVGHELARASSDDDVLVYPHSRVRTVCCCTVHQRAQSHTQSIPIAVVCCHSPGCRGRICTLCPGVSPISCTNLRIRSSSRDCPPASRERACQKHACIHLTLASCNRLCNCCSRRSARLRSAATLRASKQS